MTLLAGLLRSRRRVIAHMGAGTQDTGGLNAASPLGDELLWAVVSGAHPGRDRVGGYQGQAEGAAALATDGAGLVALRSPGWSGAGWYWPTTGIALGTACTVAMRLRLESPTGEDLEGKDDAFPKLLTIPYRDEATWLVPFGWNFALLPLSAGATSAPIRFISPLSATQRNRATSPSGFVLLDGAEHTYTVRVRSDGDVDWWRDGAPIGTTAWQDFAHAAPDLGDAPHLIAFAEHRRLLEEGLRGTMPAAAIWGKALSDQQIADFHANPWDLAEIAADPPVPAALHAWDDFVTLPAGEVSAVSVLANDSGDGRTIDSVTQPAGTHAGTGVAIVDGGAGIEVTIDAAETADAFDFEYVAKAAGDQESTAKVHVEVFVSPPLGADNAYTLTPGETHTVSPLANDNAPESSTIQSLHNVTGAVSGTSVAINADDERVDVTIAEAQAGVPFSFQYTADGPGVSPWTQTVTITVEEAAPPISGENEDLPYFGRFYGGYPIGHGVGNSNLNGVNISSFFWGDRTAVVKGFQMHWRFGPGYSAGDGGRYTIGIVPANPTTKRPILPLSFISVIHNHNPAALLNMNPATGNGNRHEERNFTTQGQITAKQPYCYVIINTHSNPGSNYLAINNDCHAVFHDDSGGANQGPGELFWNPARIHLPGGQTRAWFPWPTTGRGSNWNLRWRRIGPFIANIVYADDVVSGWGCFGTASSYIADLTSSSMLRERFRVTRASRVVDGVWVFCWRQNTSGGNLVAQLESGPSSDTSGNGTVIETASIALSSIHNVGSSLVRHESSPGADDIDYVPWVFLPFSQPRTLQLGQLYNLRLHSSGGTVKIRTNGRGELQGLSPIASSWEQHEQIRKISWLAWEDSRGCMTSSNSGSSWSFFGARRQAPILFRCVI